MTLSHIFFLIIFLILPSLCYGGIGIIIVRESPIFLKPSIDSPILQKKIKGNQIYIHSDHFSKHEYEKLKEKNNIYFDKREVSHFSKNEASSKDENSIYSEEFYRTIDDYGNDGFVPKRYVKLVFNDEREKGRPIKPFKIDPTAPRLSQIENQDYPFYERNKMRGGVDLGLISDWQKYYDYPSGVTSYKKSTPIDLSFNYLVRPSYDWAQDLFLGGALYFNYNKRELLLKNGVSSEEKRMRFGVGAISIFNIFQNNQYDLDIFISPILNIINQLSVMQKKQNGDYEKKYFATYNISTRLGMAIHKKNLLGGSDLSLKFFTEFFPSYTLQNRNKSESQISNFWKSHQIKNRFETLFGLSVGIQSIK